MLERQITAGKTTKGDGLGSPARYLSRLKSNKEKYDWDSPRRREGGKNCPPVGINNENDANTDLKCPACGKNYKR